MVRELTPRTDAPDWEAADDVDGYLAAVRAYVEAHAPTVRFPMGDGYAIYKVVDGGGTLALQHLPVLDAWQIPAAHMRGLTAQDVRAMIERDRRLAELFGGQ